MAHVTETQIRVRNPDMDSQGWVNNARYVEYFGEGRLDHIDYLKRETPGEVPGTFTLAEMLIQYKTPARHRDVLDVRVWTQEISNRSFKLGLEIKKTNTDVVVAQGHSVQVWINDQRAVQIPDLFRSVLEKSMQ
ncbi:MAG: acyl-CoA thioesterase [SAR202 cluster bacterium]|nr:acyl-CoA thioesterase [SAR202 cluster bacterium]|tara:strand:+ start:1994 stop:2395 length:402 start_codon:yes stop_codon:yes gene_type:complete